jgi:exopolysaccharide biosynthesis polyprenyl glycosylphosphotransferase
MDDTVRDWRSRYSRRLLLLDAAVITWAVAGAYIVRFGYTDSPVVADSDVTYLAVALLLGGAWWLMLILWGSRDTRVLGAGTEEYKRVVGASAWLFGIVAVVSYAFRIDTARGFVGLAFPAGALGLLVARWLVRQHLSLDRRLGRSSSRVLIIGGPHSARHLLQSLSSVPAAGYDPVAVHLPGARPAPGNEWDFAVPVTGVSSDLPALLTAVETSQADTVAISAGALLTPAILRRLGWELAARDVGMILAPALTDIAGPRIHTQPVAGLPLIHVSTPKLAGGKKLTKRAFDVLVSGLLLLALSPVLLTVAVLVRASSRGPIFYAQERIGLNGSTFKMLKFRSMMVDADLQLHALLAAQGSADKPLFKIENDPRITNVGRFLRKYSLDELPQLINVFTGSMSLVGPRPQREGEVALYDDAAHRRLYVSPGMSGLWQVSGRSNLTWEESIRLDLYYVENWSLFGDVVILLKTFRAVFTSSGAF